MINIIDKSKCMGCHACSNICPQKCIEMTNDKEGFLYPKIDQSKCINCGICENVCPILYPTIIDNVPSAFAAYNKNENIRIDSSSGGVFTLFAEYVINKNGVVFGAAFDKNFNVVHKYVDHIEQLLDLRGSKYTQSKIGNTYNQAKEFLDNGKLVMFTGTPCQIGGLKSYLKKDYDNLICQDIVCHGVPSQTVWKKYILFREKSVSSPVQKVVFRCKDEGWKRYSVSFLFNNGRKYQQLHDKDLMMMAFLRNVCLRPSCYDCAFKSIHRESDITLADFWGIQNIMPEMDDDKGTSLLILNSPKGKELFEEVKNKMKYKPTNLNEAIRYNSSAVSSVEKNPKRELFFKNLDTYTFEQLVKKYCKDGFLCRAKWKIRSILSKIKHCVFKDKENNA